MDRLLISWIHNNAKRNDFNLLFTYWLLFFRATKNYCSIWPWKCKEMHSAFKEIRSIVNWSWIHNNAKRIDFHLSFTYSLLFFNNWNFLHIFHTPHLSFSTEPRWGAQGDFAFPAHLIISLYKVNEWTLTSCFCLK